MNKKELLSSISSKKMKIGVIGLGYVGLPLVKRFSEKGFQTVGFDIDEEKISKLEQGNSYIQHIDDKTISTMKQNRFHATSNFDEISDVDVIIICVPTPLGSHSEPDLSYIYHTLDLIKNNIREYQVLILESTTYPGTTEDEITTVLSNKKNLTIGENFFIGFSPEREDPGNKDFSTKNIPKVVSGVTQNCLDIIKALYDEIIDETVPVSSPRVAEMTKILENIHRAVNIGLVNELKIVADKMNIDIYEVIRAAATKPFGFTPYYPGPGLGGHCIPIDPFYLTWKAKEVGMTTRFIELAGEINTKMPNYVVQKITDSLNNFGKSIKDSQIVVLGLSYKKNIDDLRESPSLHIIDILTDKGAIVSYHDPFFKEIPRTRRFNFHLNSIDLTAKSLNEADLVLLATDHDDFDYELIEKESKIIIDTRGKFLNDNKKIFRA